MKHYIDITLLPSDDIGVHFLWSKVMMQVHLALVEIQDENKQVPVAVGFPRYREGTSDSPAFMGNKLRLFTVVQSDLEKLNIHKWLNRLDDYVHIKNLSDVPVAVEGYESFNRYRKVGNPERLIKRRMKRHNETREQAKDHFKGFKSKIEDKGLPYIQMKSLESGNDFMMSIIRKNIEKSESSVNNLMFNTYGLNGQAVLPKF